MLSSPPLICLLTLDRFDREVQLGPHILIPQIFRSRRAIEADDSERNSFCDTTADLFHHVVETKTEDRNVI